MRFSYRTNVCKWTQCPFSGWLILLKKTSSQDLVGHNIVTPVILQSPKTFLVSFSLKISSQYVSRISQLTKHRTSVCRAIQRSPFLSCCKRTVNDRYLHALETWSGRDAHVFAYSVRVSVDQTPSPSSRSPIGIGEEVRRHRGRGGGGRRSHIHRRGLRHRTFVPGAAETLYVLLVAAEYGWWAALLQADDVAAETETKVARIVPWHLLGGHVHLAAVPGGTRSV